MGDKWKEKPRWSVLERCWATGTVSVRLGIDSKSLWNSTGAMENTIYAKDIPSFDVSAMVVETCLTRRSEISQLGSGMVTAMTIAYCIIYIP